MVRAVRATLLYGLVLVLIASATADAAAAGAADAATGGGATTDRPRQSGEWDDESFDSLPPSQRDSMPDKDDIAIREQLRCSVCHWCVVELYGELRALEKRVQQLPAANNRKRKQHETANGLRAPGQDAIDDLFDEFCDRHYPNFGLHVDSETNTVKPKFTKLAGRVQGSWVSRMFQNECSAFLVQFQTSTQRRSWEHLSSLWGDKDTIEEPKFLDMCAACRTANGKKGFPSRSESLMWVDEATRLQEDWDL
jgi:hypothetical protein